MPHAAALLPPNDTMMQGVPACSRTPLRPVSCEHRPCCTSIRRSCGEELSSTNGEPSGDPVGRCAADSNPARPSASPPPRRNALPRPTSPRSLHASSISPRTAGRSVHIDTTAFRRTELRRRGPGAATRRSPRRHAPPRTAATAATAADVAADATATAANTNTTTATAATAQAAATAATAETAAVTAATDADADPPSYPPTCRAPSPATRRPLAPFLPCEVRAPRAATARRLMTDVHARLRVFQDARGHFGGYRDGSGVATAVAGSVGSPGCVCDVHCESSRVAAALAGVKLPCVGRPKKWRLVSVFFSFFARVWALRPMCTCSLCTCDAVRVLLSCVRQCQPNPVPG